MMGADIYLMSVYEKQNAEWEPKFRAACAVRDEVWERRRQYQDDGQPVPEELQAEYEAAQAVVNEAFDQMYAKGYYRDSYNSGNSMWPFGLSYWEEIDSWRRKSDGKMGLRGMRKWLKYLEDNGRRVLTEEHVRNHLTEREIRFTEDDESDGNFSTLKDWLNYYKGCYEDLTSLLRQAIELKEPLVCSF